MPGSFLQNDLNQFLKGNDFGESGVLWKGVSIENVIYDEEDVEEQLGEGPTQIVTERRLMGKTADFPSIQSDDPVTIGGSTFYVSHWIDDGTGMITVYLNERSS
jgi:hypothetical protein